MLNAHPGHRRECLQVKGVKVTAYRIQGVSFFTSGPSSTRQEKKKEGAAYASLNSSFIRAAFAVALPRWQLLNMAYVFFACLPASFTAGASSPSSASL